MTATDIQLDTAQSALRGPDQTTTTLLAVVGFDGSAPAMAALDAATQLIRGRNGHLEIVYVAHLPGYVTMSAQAIVGIREGFTDVAAELSEVARTALDGAEPRWHFQRRDGAVATELVATAKELRHQYGPDASIVIIVGVSTHLAHHLAGSIAVSLARDAGFPLLVVPVPPQTGSPEEPPADVAHYLG